MHRKQALHSMRQSGIIISIVFTAADINYLNGETSFLATICDLTYIWVLHVNGSLTRMPYDSERIVSVPIVDQGHRVLVVTSTEIWLLSATQSFSRQVQKRI